MNRNLLLRLQAINHAFGGLVNPDDLIRIPEFIILNFSLKPVRLYTGQFGNHDVKLELLKKCDEKSLNIATNHPIEAKRLRIVLVITSLLLALGLVSPIITLKKFVLIENTFSVVSGTLQLLKEGQIFLFMLITAFSVVLPWLKIAVLFILLGPANRNNNHMDRYLHWMHLYGKWSMLDVFVVAVLVVAVKLGAIASVEMRYGLYAFAAAVVLTMWVTARVVSLSSDSAHDRQKT